MDINHLSFTHCIDLRYYSTIFTYKFVRIYLCITPIEQLTISDISVFSIFVTSLIMYIFAVSHFTDLSAFHPPSSIIVLPLPSKSDDQVLYPSYGHHMYLSHLSTLVNLCHHMCLYHLSTLVTFLSN